MKENLRSRLINYAQRFVGDYAEDAVSQTCLRLLQAGFDLDKAAPGLFFTTLIWVIRDELRRQSRFVGAEPPDRGEAASVEARILVGQLERLVPTLRILWKAEVEGLTHAEIAQEIGSTPATLRC